MCAGTRRLAALLSRVATLDRALIHPPATGQCRAGSRRVLPERSYGHPVRGRQPMQRWGLAGKQGVSGRVHAVQEAAPQLMDDLLEGGPLGRVLHADSEGEKRGKAVATTTPAPPHSQSRTKQSQPHRLKDTAGFQEQAPIPPQAAPAPSTPRPGADRRVGRAQRRRCRRGPRAAPRGSRAAAAGSPP